jgi:hypothetical protein
MFAAMKARLARLTSKVLVVAACCLAFTACSSLHMPSMHMPKIWPFYKKPKAGPEAVNELTLVNADGSGATYPQYWVRNTLVIDLSGISGQGGFAARLPEESTWPVRVAVRVQPGSVGQLEVQAEERNILPVTNLGAKPVDIELSPSLYTPKTAAIYIAWGATPVFAEATPAESAPTFVSPTEVPKPAPVTAPGATETPGANEIIAPAEARPTQPSPPPGS